MVGEKCGFFFFEGVVDIFVGFFILKFWFWWKLFWWIELSNGGIMLVGLWFNVLWFIKDFGVDIWGWVGWGLNDCISGWGDVIFGDGWFKLKEGKKVDFVVMVIGEGFLEYWDIRVLNRWVEGGGGGFFDDCVDFWGIGGDVCKDEDVLGWISLLWLVDGRVLVVVGNLCELIELEGFLLYKLGKFDGLELLL